MVSSSRAGCGQEEEVTGFDLNQAADQVHTKVKSEPHVPTKEEMASYTKSKRSKERRDQKPRRRRRTPRNGGRNGRKAFISSRINLSEIGKTSVFKDLAQALDSPATAQLWRGDGDLPGRQMGGIGVRQGRRD